LPSFLPLLEFDWSWQGNKLAVSGANTGTMVLDFGRKNITK
jgi:hypothetical protein